MPFEPFADSVWRYKPEPATEEAKELAKKIEPAKFSIFAHKLQMIAMEGKEVITRTGATVTCTGTDLNTGLYSADGDVTMSASGVWVHAFGPQLAIKFVLRAFKDDPGIKDGDCWHVSDALRYGLTHINDQETFMPVFYNGQLVAWVSAQMHQPDVGAAELGLAQTVKNKYEDGMLISPIRIARNHKLDVDLVDMIAYMTRDSRNFQLDMRTRWAACMRQRARILEMVEKEGLDLWFGGCRRIIDEGREYTSKKMLGWLDGTFRDVQFLDTTGPELSLRRVAVTVHKKGDRLTLDITGTSPEAPGPYNTPGNLIPGMLAPNFFSFLLHDVLPNAGAYDQMDFVVPKGTLMSPRWEAPEPVAVAGILAGFYLQGTFWRPAAKMAFASPDRIAVAAGVAAGPFCVPQFFGIDPSGVFGMGINMEANAEGGGGRWGIDGIDCQQTIWATLVDAEDAEYHERNFPFVYIVRTKGRDSCGFGKYRGGSGMEYVYVIGDTPYWVTLNIACGLNFPAAAGLFGGYQGSTGAYHRIMNSKFFEQAKEGKIRLQVKVDDLMKEALIEGEYSFHKRAIGMEQMKKGDIVHAFSAGGGGYGDVLERDPEAVMGDIRQNILTHSTAQNVYIVVYNPETLEVDHERTEEMRREEKERRKQRGKRYEDFEKEWLEKKPPEEWIKWFGPWPGVPVDGRIEKGLVPSEGEYYVGEEFARR